MSVVVCTKRGYRHRRDARKALRRIQSKGLNVKSSYRCRVCGLYHLTKHPASWRPPA